jgi:ELWxxDGT repeat protein
VELYADTSGDSFFDFTLLGGSVFFEKGRQEQGYVNQLWKTDGTPAGTTLFLGGVHSDLTVVNGKLFFARDDGVNGNELWDSDGTVAGTVLVKDIYPGTTTTRYQVCPYGSRHCYWVTVTKINSSNPSGLTNVNGTLYFQANDGTHGPELWKSDGTAAGTVLVKDINPGSAASSPSSLTNLNGTLFFSANDGTTGQELWKSDGTAAGTVLVKDIDPGSSNSYPSDLTNASGTLYFAANDGTHGTELWQSNGTAAGTVLVADINTNPSSAGSNPMYLTVVGAHLFFVANDGYHGYELWDPPSAAAATTSPLIVQETSQPALLALPPPGRSGTSVAAGDAAGSLARALVQAPGIQPRLQQPADTIGEHARGGRSHGCCRAPGAASGAARDPTGEPCHELSGPPPTGASVSGRDQRFERGIGMDEGQSLQQSAGECPGSRGCGGNAGAEPGNASGRAGPGLCRTGRGSVFGRLEQGTGIRPAAIETGGREEPLPGSAAQQDPHRPEPAPGARSARRER